MTHISYTDYATARMPFLPPAPAYRLADTLRRRRIEAVLWDLDGTLVDSEGSFQAQAFTQAMQLVHAVTPPLTALGIPHTVGKTPDEIFDDMCAAVGIPAAARRIEQLMAARQHLLGQIIREGVSLMPGVAELLPHLRRAGVKLAVASQSPQWQADLVVQAAGIAPYFDLIVGGDNVPRERRKPEPDLYQLAARRLGVSPEHCLALEDTLLGATAGVRAGCHTILIPTRYNPYERGHLCLTLYGTLANTDGLLHLLQRPIYLN